MINIWKLGASKGDGLVHMKTVDGYNESAITTLSLWNRIATG